METEKSIKKDPPMGITPILSVNGAAQAAVFYQRAFGANEIARIGAPDGRRLLHVRMEMFKSIFVFMDEFPEFSGIDGGFRPPDLLRGTSVTIHIQVEDAREVWAKAIEAGAQIVIQLEYQFWGELYGRLKDPYGHEWTIAQMVNHLQASEIEKATIHSSAR